jgi:hypothetical protein
MHRSNFFVSNPFFIPLGILLPIRKYNLLKL